KLLAAGGLDDRQRHDLEVVGRNARTLLKHVNDLLDVAKLEAGKMAASYARVDLARLVRLVAGHFDGLGEERRIALSVEAPEEVRASPSPCRWWRQPASRCGARPRRSTRAPSRSPGRRSRSSAHASRRWRAVRKWAGRGSSSPKTTPR